MNVNYASVFGFSGENYLIAVPDEERLKKYAIALTENHVEAETFNFYEDVVSSAWQQMMPAQKVSHACMLAYQIVMQEYLLRQIASFITRSEYPEANKVFSRILMVETEHTLAFHRMLNTLHTEGEKLLCKDIEHTTCLKRQRNWLCALSHFSPAGQILSLLVSNYLFAEGIFSSLIRIAGKSALSESARFLDMFAINKQLVNQCYFFFYHHYLNLIHVPESNKVEACVKEATGIAEKILADLFPGLCEEEKKQILQHTEKNAAYLIEGLGAQEFLFREFIFGKQCEDINESMKSMSRNEEMFLPFRSTMFEKEIFEQPF